MSRRKNWARPRKISSEQKNSQQENSQSWNFTKTITRREKRININTLVKKIRGLFKTVFFFLMQRKMWAENARAYRKLANCNIVFRFQPMSKACNGWLCWSGAQTSQGGRGRCKELGKGETRNRPSYCPSLECRRAIAHLFATLSAWSR